MSAVEVFRFPATKFVGENSVSKQFSHVMGELQEAWEILEAEYPRLADPVRFAEELLDLIHSTETELRILIAEYAVDVDALALAIVQKNRVRGYYAD